MGMGIPNNHSNPARAISASYVSDCVATGEPRPSSKRYQQCGWNAVAGRVVCYTMARTHRYSIEIKDANGKSVLFTTVHWDEEDRRAAVAQILRLNGVPEVYYFAEPRLKPRCGKE
jgi:hypothetical protein